MGEKLALVTGASSGSGFSFSRLANITPWALRAAMHEKMAKPLDEK